MARLTRICTGEMTHEGIERALSKAERYRLLNEPVEAASICRDVLAVDPGNQHARLCFTDP